MAEEHKISIVVDVKDRASSGLAEIESGIASKTSKMGAMFSTLSVVAAGAFAAVSGAVATGLNSAIKYEEAFTGIRKTVNASEADFQKISDNIRNLSRQMPQSAVELAQIGEIAGQLGIHGADDLNKFIEVVGKLALATNLSAEDAAKSLASITQVMNEPIQDVDKLASTLVYLGNNFNATEKDIVAWGKRLSGIGEVAGFTASEILAIGAAGAASGVQAEAGATALQTLFIQMQQAASGATSKIIDNSKAIGKQDDQIKSLNTTYQKQQNRLEELNKAGNTSSATYKNLVLDMQSNREKADGLNSSLSTLESTHGSSAISANEFAKVMGLTNKEFQNIWKSNPSQAFEQLMLALNKANAEGKDVTSMLGDLDVSNIRAIRTVLSMSGNVDDLTRALKGQATAYEQNSALDTEFEKKKAAAATQIKIFKNNIEDLSISLGNIFLPTFNNVLKTIVPMLDTMAGKFKTFTDRLGEMVTSGAGDFSQMFNFGEMKTTIEGKFGPLVEYISGGMDRIKQILNNAGISGEFGGLVNFFSDMAEKVDWYSKRTIDIVSDFYQKVKNFLAFGGTEGDATIVEALKGIWNRIKPIKDALEPLFKKMADNMAMTSAVINEQIVPAFDALKEVAGPLWEALAPILQDKLIKAFQGFAIFLGAIVAVILGIVTGLVNGIANALPYIAQAIEGIIQFFRGLVQLITGLINGDLSLAFEGLKQMFAGIWDAFNNTVIAIIKLVTGFVQGVIEFFKALYDALIGNSIIPDLVNGIIGWFVSLYDTTIGQIKEWVAGMLKQISEWKDKAVSTIGSLVGSVKELFTNMISNAKDWGTNLIKNWVQGIKDSIKNLGGKLADKAREAFGLDQMEHGGIVPGPIGDPVPIIAHGGERVIPRTGTDSQGGTVNNSTGVNITFTGPVSMDSTERVEELAKMIELRLGRQNELARYGVGF